MIRKEILGKNDTDTLEQFRNGYDFKEAFIAPFMPDPAASPAKAKPASLPAGTGS
jgi:uncharacterized repeat protein (TIGR04138 family)